MEGSTIGAHQVNSAYHRRVPVLGELGSATSSQLSSTLAVTIDPAGIHRAARSALAAGHRHPDRDRSRPRRCGAGSGKRWLVAPAIAYGASGEHQSFAGTISIGTEALTTLLVEYGRSAACWAERLVFVNGHGGNVGALNRAVSQTARRGP